MDHDDPPDDDRPGGPDPAVDSALTLLLASGLTLRAISDRLIARAVACHGGDRRAAARHLGVALKTIYNRVPVGCGTVDAGWPATGGERPKVRKGRQGERCDD